MRKFYLKFNFYLIKSKKHQTILVRLKHFSVNHRHSKIPTVLTMAVETKEPNFINKLAEF